MHIFMYEITYLCPNYMANVAIKCKDNFSFLTFMSHYIMREIKFPATFLQVKFRQHAIGNKLN